MHFFNAKNQRRKKTMTITNEMYSMLFNHITDIQKDLQRIIDNSQKIQIDVEEKYINKDS